MSLKSSDISFVVQGPVVSETASGVFSTTSVLESIRKHYPVAEIILSTWKGTDVAELTFDKVILSDDPGGFTHNGVLINNNRLIHSTKAGIAAATRKYLVKTRTDILINDNSLLQQLAGLRPLKGKYALFGHQVLSTVYYVRNPLVLNLVFHGSDIFLAGFKEDVAALFDADAQPREFFINADESTRIVAEQYLLINAIWKKQNKKYDVKRWEQVSLQFFRLSEQYIFKNYKFLDVKEMGIAFPERLYAAFMHHANYKVEDARLLNHIYSKRSLIEPVIIKRLLAYWVKYYMPKSFGLSIIRLVNKLKSAFGDNKRVPISITKN
jgi:hypothetical protein